MLSIMQLFLYAYLVGINGLEIFLMYYDKRQAKRGQYRVSEAILLIIGMMGGGIGGLISQQLFSHKIRKLRFYFCYLLGTFVASALIYFCHGQ